MLLQESKQDYRVKSCKPDQLVNLITLRFLDFGVHEGRQQVYHQLYSWQRAECTEVAKNWSGLQDLTLVTSFSPWTENPYAIYISPWIYLQLNFHGWNFNSEDKERYCHIIVTPNYVIITGGWRPVRMMKEDRQKNLLWTCFIDKFKMCPSSRKQSFCKCCML